jgi:amino acid permease
VSTVTESGTRSSGKRIGALILAIVGVLLVILALIYMVSAAGSLPSFIPGHIAGSTGHHPLRVVGCLILGVVFAVGAWFAMRHKGPVEEADNTAEKTPADL